jgi:kynureninase
MSPESFAQQLEHARSLDAADPLSAFSARFAHPAAADGTRLTYLCGHSLGLAPLAAGDRLHDELHRWQTLGVQGHEHGSPGWISYADSLVAALAGLAGAQADEVVAMNSLSVNLHLLLAAFYRPQASRRAVLIEAGAFSSDRHVVATQIALHGGDPARDLIELAPAPGHDLLQMEEIEASIRLHADRLALVLWPGVQFRTGQYFEAAPIVRAAHAVGAMAGFDMAHAIGNIPLALHDSQADFAAWCSYKYLNGGPGAVGGAFIHERHLQQRGVAHLAGWWGHELATRFDMPAQFRPARGAAAWAISNPPVFSTAPLRASLPMFEEAGPVALRQRSRRLTGYLASKLQEFAGHAIRLVTPADPLSRGCQLSIRLSRDAVAARAVFEQLQSRGVIADWRAPDIIRFAPVPLYNSYEDALRCAHVLGDCL